MLILNLGCGVAVSAHCDVVNIDWSIYLRLKQNPLLRGLAALMLKGERAQRFHALTDNIVAHDLRKGIPFGPDSVDVVYTCHLLEHFDRETASAFLREIRRALKPGGFLRIVVPDFEQLCRRYLSHIAECEKDPIQSAQHDLHVAAMIEQSVRREAYGTSRQPPLQRFVENLLLGDARKRGETHQWAYDRINLARLLRLHGYGEIRIQKYNTSCVPDWHKYGLDTDKHGNEVKPGSLYMEARK